MGLNRERECGRIGRLRLAADREKESGAKEEENGTGLGNKVCTYVGCGGVGDWRRGEEKGRENVKLWGWDRGREIQCGIGKK